MYGFGAGNLRLAERLNLALRLINAALLNQWQLTQAWISECKYHFVLSTMHKWNKSEEALSQTLASWSLHEKETILYILIRRETRLKPDIRNTPSRVKRERFGTAVSAFAMILLIEHYLTPSNFQRYKLYIFATISRSVSLA